MLQLKMKETALDQERKRMRQLERDVKEREDLLNENIAQVPSFSILKFLCI